MMTMMEESIDLGDPTISMPTSVPETITIDEIHIETPEERLYFTIFKSCLPDENIYFI